MTKCEEIEQNYKKFSIYPIFQQKLTSSLCYNGLAGKKVSLLTSKATHKGVERKELTMSKAFETAKAELKSIYNQLTEEEKQLLLKKKQQIIEARDIQNTNNIVKE